MSRVEKAKTVAEIVEIVFNVIDKIVDRKQKKEGQEKRIADLESEIARLKKNGTRE